MYKNTSKAFTLIELLVVITIIGLLSTIVLASLNTARGKARDARRMSDLNQIKNALIFYYDKYGNYVSTGSGCGWQGGGLGWFNASNGDPLSYPASITSCLVGAGFLPSEIKDPTGSVSGSTPSNTVYSYMKYDCTISGQRTVYVYAKLETLPQSTTATDGTCQPTLDTVNGMNYFVKI